MKKKMNKRKETRLDILSTNEDDESEKGNDDIYNNNYHNNNCEVNNKFLINSPFKEKQVNSNEFFKKITQKNFKICKKYQRYFKF